MNIAYACNEAYLEQTMVSLTSLFENNKDTAEIHVYFIDMGVTNEGTKELKNLAASYNRCLEVVPFNSIAYDLNVKDTGRHIQSVYAKLFFGRIKEIDKILYLDSDIIIASTLKPLWEMDLGNCVCAGVETIHTLKDNEIMGLTRDDRAINDGMLLMNLVAWREGDYLNKCLHYIELYDGKPPVLSEGTINNVCRGKIKILDPRYNLMSAIVGANAKKIMTITGRNYYSQKTIDDATENPVIIHYLSGFFNRPWCKECNHPLKNEYLKYRAMTRWANAPLSEKKLPIRLKAIGFLYNNLPGKVFVKIRKYVGAKA